MSPPNQPGSPGTLIAATQRFAEKDIKVIRHCWSIVDLNFDDIVLDLGAKIHALTSSPFSDVDALKMIMETHAITFGTFTIEDFQRTPIDPRDIQLYRRHADNRNGLFACLFGLPVFTDAWYPPKEKFLNGDEVCLVLLRDPFEFPATYPEAHQTIRRR